MQIKIDINVCRVCLQSTVGTSLFKNDNLMEQFTGITRLEVADGDGLPESLCSKCVARLKVAYDFKKQSELSEKHLRAFIVQVNTKFNENSELFYDDGKSLLEILGDEHDDDDGKQSEVENQIDMENIEDHYIVDLDDNENVNQTYIEEQSNKDHLVEILSIERIDTATVENSKLIATKSNSGGMPKDKRTHVDRDSMHMCNTCNKHFSSQAILERHMRAHDGSRPFTCLTCGNGFTQKRLLDQHMNIHTGERPFKCTHCEKSFRQLETLRVHKSVLHMGKKYWKTLPCELCHKILHSKLALVRHLKKHKQNSKNQFDGFKCDTCEKKFLNLRALANHARMHMTADKPFKCCNCLKEFVSKAALIVHNSAQHAQERPYKCCVCGEEVSEHQQILAHRNLHDSSIRRYSCSICSKRFYVKLNMLAHMKNHENDLVTYRCEDCDLSFKKWRSFQLHRTTEHREVIANLNKCEDCCISFITENDLNDHLKGEHGDNDGTSVSDSIRQPSKPRRTNKRRKVVSN